MPIEHERRWLYSFKLDRASQLSDHILFARLVKLITQVYLSETPSNVVRVRKTVALDVEGVAPVEYMMTIKSPTEDPAKSEEVELELEEKRAEKLMGSFMVDYLPYLHKRRYICRLTDAQEVQFEVDVLAGRHTGIVIIEVENPPENFTAPNWFGKEITGVRPYSNASLAKLTREEVNTLMSGQQG